MFNFKKKKEKSKENIDSAPPDAIGMYYDLRNQALTIKAFQIGVEPGGEYPVYGAVIDLMFGENIATMISMLDGTVSLYYSNGGGIIGIGERYDDIREHGFNLLANAGHLIKHFSVTDDFSLPTEDYACYAFFLTDNGVYKATFHMDHDDEGDVYDFLNYLIQNLLTSIRLNAERDGF